MAPPVGLQLGSEHRVGKLLGEGAFGQVHLVVNSSKKETAWACKLTAVPKATRKKNSAAEVAHQRLFAEHMLYSNHMRGLCGTVLPQLPSLTNDGIDVFYNDLNGAFFFLRFWSETTECNSSTDNVHAISTSSTVAFYIIN